MDRCAQRHHLLHAHVQMARELGMNPKTLGKIDNHKQQPWKAPLPEFIEFLYERRFGRRRPENVLSIEALARKRARQEDARRRAKAERRLARRSATGLPVHGEVGHGGTQSHE